MRRNFGARVHTWRLRRARFQQWGLSNTAGIQDPDEFSRSQVKVMAWTTREQKVAHY